MNQLHSKVSGWWFQTDLRIWAVLSQQEGNAKRWTRYQSSDRNPGCLGYIGDYTTQLYRDYKNIGIIKTIVRILSLNNQYNGHVTMVFITVKFYLPKPGEVKSNLTCACSFCLNMCVVPKENITPLTRWFFPGGVTNKWLYLEDHPS